SDESGGAGDENHASLHRAASIVKSAVKQSNFLCPAPCWPIQHGQIPGHPASLLLNRHCLGQQLRLVVASIRLASNQALGRAQCRWLPSRSTTNTRSKTVASSLPGHRRW